MEQNTPTRVHCFFEQSGTFKNEFIKLGIPAEDYDIQNNFGQTDHVIDLFAQIEAAYDGQPSVFDTIQPSDLIMAFFPCIYFCAMSQVSTTWACKNYRKLTIKQKSDAILERIRNRERFLGLAIKMLTIAAARGLQLVMENPWSEQTYLKTCFIIPPQFVDNDRTRRGDYFRKPTAYWFVGRYPGNGKSYQQTPPDKIRKIEDTPKGKTAGICSEERSMISPDYARNFICDFILGKRQSFTELELFSD